MSSAGTVRAHLAELSRLGPAARRGAKVGQPLPAERLEQWRRALSEVDEVLRIPPSAARAETMDRIRRELEREVELDAKAWGDIPDDLSEAVFGGVTRLSIRLAELKRRVRPREERVQLAWPIQPVRITSLFGRRFHPIFKERRQHWGIDLAAKLGQVVMAAASGKVVKARRVGASGLHVEVRHADGAITGYSHLSKILVAEGAEVRQGDPVGMAGRTGRATGPHLHFELWRGGKARDPLEALKTLPPSEVGVASAQSQSR